MQLMNMFPKHRILFSLLLIYGISRIIMIITFPLFFDEAIYIHWAQYILDDHFWKWVSLIDGKQPLFIWGISFLHFFIPNPILAGRMVSVCAGIGSMIGIYLISKDVDHEKTGLIACALYLCMSFFLIYDSLALMDSLLMSLSIFAVFFSVRLAKYTKIQDGMCLGVIIGLGLLTKSSAQFFFFYPLFTFLLLSNVTVKTVGKYFLFMIMAIAIAKGMESILRLSTYFPVVAQKNSEFSRSIAEVLKNEGPALKDNFQLTTAWLTSYLSWPVIILSIVSLFFIKKKIYVVFLLFSLFPIVVTVLIGKQLYPRHFLFMTWPLLILLSQLFVQVQEKFFSKKIYLLPIMIIIVFCMPLYTSLMLVINPTHAPLTDKERWQFFNGEPSGIGLPLLITEIKKYEQPDKKLLILADKPLGILPDGIAIHFFGKENVKAEGTNEINSTTLKRYISGFHPDTILMVTSQQNSPRDISSKELLTIERIGDTNKNWKLFKAE